MNRFFIIKESMQIRKLERKDLPRVFELYAAARERMKQGGNPTQWKDSHPAPALVEGDVERGTGYVVEEEGEIIGVFAFIIGEEPTYSYIEGEWLDDGPYGTMHRVAGDGIHKGVLKSCLDFCEAQVRSVRVDTHENNKIMRHLLPKYGYRECGVIYIVDGSPRVAYQKVIGQ